MYKVRIFLVEDDPNLAFTICDGLTMAGYRVDHEVNGQVASTAFHPGTYDICLLDVMLPGKDGFTLAREIRLLDADIPLLFLTARSMEEDKLTGFGLGADDYITKPFSMKELLCRIEVFLRRRKSPAIHSDADIPLTIGNYSFDYVQLKLNHGNACRMLTQREADVLAFLSKHMNRLLRREEILEEVWGEDDYFMGRSLDVFISRLRRYLKDDRRLEIRNNHSIGFTLFCHDKGD